MSLRSELHDHATEVNLQNEASHAKKYFEDISIDLWTSAGTGNYQFELPYSKYERVYKNRYLYDEIQKLLEAEDLKLTEELNTDDKKVITIKF